MHGTSQLEGSEVKQSLQREITSHGSMEDQISISTGSQKRLIIL